MKLTARGKTAYQRDRVVFTLATERRAALRATLASSVEQLFGCSLGRTQRGKSNQLSGILRGLYSRDWIEKKGEARNPRVLLKTRLHDVELSARLATHGMSAAEARRCLDALQFALAAIEKARGIQIDRDIRVRFKTIPAKFGAGDDRSPVDEGRTPIRRNKTA